MSARNSRTTEFIRLLAMSLVGGLLTLITRFFFQEDWLLGRFFTDAAIKDAWVAEYYNFWSLLVFGISTFAALTWYGWCCAVPDKGPGRNSSMQLPWWILSFFPFLAVLTFVFSGFPMIIIPTGTSTVTVNNEVDSIVQTIAMFFLMLIGVVGYWLGTAINSPAPFTYIPPLSHTIRRLLSLS